MIFAFLLCRCCFIEFPALLIPKSLKKKSIDQHLEIQLEWKNALQDYLIVGKLCVCQMATFLVGYSSRADCCIGEQKRNNHKLKILNGIYHYYLET